MQVSRHAELDSASASRLDQTLKQVQGDEAQPDSEASVLFRHCDFHIHTRYSPCAQPDMHPAKIIRLAQERGIENLGFTDHVFGFTDPKVVTYARDECPETNGSVKVFFGCEADVLSVGKTAVTQEMRDTLDYITISASHFHNDYEKMVEPPESDEPEVVGKHYLKMFSYAASLDYADVIAHPFYVMPGTYDVGSIYTLTVDDLMPAIELAAANGVAVEMSRRAVTREHINFMKVFYRLCKNAGVKIAIGSDAHNLATVGQTGTLASLIEELGLRDDDFWLPRKNGGDK